MTSRRGRLLAAAFYVVLGIATLLIGWGRSAITPFGMAAFFAVYAFRPSRPSGP